MVIYKTTNIINKKYYIGKDAKNSKNYLGSGVALNNAIKKYGKENFTKEILCYCIDLCDLNQKEIEYVNEEIVNDPMSYNLVLGGQGGDHSKFIKNWYLKGKTYEEVFGEERAKKIKQKKNNSLKGKNNGMYDNGDKIKGEKNGMYGRKGELCPAYKNGHEAWNKGKKGLQKHSDETKQTMSNSQKNRERKYYIQQIDNKGNVINEFTTIIEAVNILKISKKKAYANTFLEFTFKKIYK